MSDERVSYPKKGIVWAAVPDTTWRTRNNGEIARRFGVSLQTVKTARARHSAHPSPLAGRGRPRSKPSIVTMRPVEPLVMTEEMRVYGVLAAILDLSAEGQAFIRKAINQSEAP